MHGFYPQISANRCGGSRSITVFIFLKAGIVDEEGVSQSKLLKKKTIPFFLDI